MFVEFFLFGSQEILRVHKRRSCIPLAGRSSNRKGSRLSYPMSLAHGFVWGTKGFARFQLSICWRRNMLNGLSKKGDELWLNYNLRCVFFLQRFRWPFQDYPPIFRLGRIPNGFQTFTLSHWQLESWEHSSAIEASELLGTHAEGLDGLPSGESSTNRYGYRFASQCEEVDLLCYDHEFSFGVSHGRSRYI